MHNLYRYAEDKTQALEEAFQHKEGCLEVGLCRLNQVYP
jgi:hypothetical protein